jgi:NAD(P)H dehydrogenase (quinone)
MTTLLIGATGNVGPHVVSALLERGASPRVLTRHAERAAGLLPGGCEILAGDPADDDTVAAAARGAESVFLLTEHAHDMTDLQLRVIRALRRSGALIVKLSGTSSAINPDGPYTCRQHWEIEQVLAASGQPHAIVRPNGFMQTLIGNIMLPAVRSTGMIPNAIGSSGISLIDARDIGDVCAAVLTEERWAGQTLVLTGPRSVTFGQIAELLSAQTGRDVGTVDITPDDVRQSLLARGMPDWEAEHFQEMYQLFRDGKSEFVTSDVEGVLGHAPRTVEDYLRECRDSLATPAGAT